MFLTVAVCSVFTSCKDNDEDLSVRSITLSSNSLTLEPGGTQTLTVNFFPENALNKNVSWSSSDPSTVEVSSSGVITALKVGSAVITAIAEDCGEKATCSVTVSAAGSATMTVGAKGGDAAPVQGVWGKNTIVNVNGQIYVPEGQSLKIEEGVQIIISAESQDNNNTKIEIIVEGSLYCYGTAAAPITFTVPAANRDQKTDGRHWGGIIGSETCAEILLDHVLIEYTGALTTASSPSVTKGLFKAGGGDGMVAFNTNNPQGKYVIQNSTFRYTSEDAIYVQGGDCLFINNLFHTVGDDGGEAINVKAGCRVVAAFNVIYSPNTNAFKLSNSGVSEVRTQAIIHAYNNTIINSGWNRDPSKPKGCSVWVEGGLVHVFNNLIVNCMFGSKAPDFGQGGTIGADAASVIDYNFYASGTAESGVQQHIENGTVTAFDGFRKEPKQPDVVHGENDIYGESPGDKDPMFVSFPFDDNPVMSRTYDVTWNFHLQAGSPALDASKVRTGFTPQHSTGITMDGKTYNSPAPAAYFGAKGAN